MTVEIKEWVYFDVCNMTYKFGYVPLNSFSLLKEALNTQSRKIKVSFARSINFQLTSSSIYLGSLVFANKSLFGKQNLSFMVMCGLLHKISKFDHWVKFGRELAP